MTLGPRPGSGQWAELRQVADSLQLSGRPGVKLLIRSFLERQEEL